MDFSKFPKIVQYNRALTDERIEVPEGSYLITEKMDGANAGIVRTEEGFLLHSRNSFLALLSEDGSHKISNEFRGFVPYVANRLDLPGFKHMQVGDHYFGEWLVPHTITYPVDMYGKFYLFDPQFYVPDSWGDIPAVKQLGYIKSPSIKELVDIANEIRDEYKRPIEGVVIQIAEDQRNPHVTRFKYVFPEFKEEVANKWFNIRKAKSDMTHEEVFANSYPGRSIVKVIEKVEDEEGFLDKRHTPKVLGMAWYDFLTEFLPDLLKKPKKQPISFGEVQTLLNNRVRHAFFIKLDTGEYPQWTVTYGTDS